MGRSEEPREHARLLNAGRLSIKQLKDFIAAPHPLQLMNRLSFPVEPTRSGATTLGIPNEVWRRLNNYDAEVLIFSREGTPGLYIVRRGWDQRWLVRAPDNCCGVFLDFRVVVADRKLGKQAAFGKTEKPVHKASVVVDQKCRFLYITIVLLVTINSDRFGESVTEQNDAVRRAREDAGLPTTLARLPRSFVVAHELAHAQDAHDRLLAAISLDRICNPDKPTQQHAARIEAAIAAEWQRFTAEGHADEGASGGYPNNAPEQRAREQAWREYDLAQQGLAPIQIP